MKRLSKQQTIDEKNIFSHAFDDLKEDDREEMRKDLKKLMMTAN